MAVQREADAGGISKNLTICVDIGHNVKNDNGAGDPGMGQLSENDAAKAIGEQVIELLERWGYKVVRSLTQADIDYLNSLPGHADGATDEQIRFGLNESLRLRCKNSDAANADLFVAIHLNGNPDGLPLEKKGRGSSIYAITNDEIALGNGILKYICNQHYELGPDEFLNGTKRLGLPFSNRGVQDGRSLYVLKNTAAPSILIECCFVDHPNDINVYMDKTPYVNHEQTKLEEGVDYVNMNIMSYNFFGYCIARGIDEYLDGTGQEQQYIKNVVNSQPLNFVCYTDSSKDKSKNAVMNYGKYEELFYGRKLAALLRSEMDDKKNIYTRVFYTYMNFNTMQSSHGYLNEKVNFSKDPKAELDSIYTESSVYRNLAYLGNEVKRGDSTYYEFKLKKDKMVFKSDGSDYFLAQAGSIIGIKKTCELDGAFGSVVCEPTNPNLIRVNYIIRKNTTEKENLYNLFSNEMYAWLEVNLGSCMYPENFDLELNI